MPNDAGDIKVAGQVGRVSIVGPSTVEHFARFYAGVPRASSPTTKTDEAEHAIGASRCQTHSALPGTKSSCQCNGAARSTPSVRLHHSTICRTCLFVFEGAKEPGCILAGFSTAVRTCRCPELKHWTVPADFLWPSSRVHRLVSRWSHASATVFPCERRVRTLRTPFSRSTKRWFVRPMTYPSRLRMRRWACVPYRHRRTFQTPCFYSKLMSVFVRGCTSRWRQPHRICKG